MPYIKVSSAKVLTEEQANVLVSGLAKAVHQFLGNPPEQVDVEINDGTKMYRGGVKQENFVYLDVRYFRNHKFRVKQELAKAVFKATHAALGTADDKMCLSILEFHNWGGFGDFIDEFVTEGI